MKWLDKAAVIGTGAYKGVRRWLRGKKDVPRDNDPIPKSPTQDVKKDAKKDDKKKGKCKGECPREENYPEGAKKVKDTKGRSTIYEKGGGKNALDKDLRAINLLISNRSKLGKER